MPIPDPKSWPLAIKLSLTITAVVASVGLMISTVMIAQDWSRFFEVLGEKALLLSGSVAVSSAKSIVRKDYWSLYLNLKDMKSKHEIISAMILDAEGMVLAHRNPVENPLGLLFSPANRAEQDLFLKAVSTRQPAVLSSGEFSKTGFQEGIVPIFSDQKYLGVVRVRLSASQLYEKGKTSAFIVLALVLCLVLFGSILGAVMSRSMLKPLTAVTQGLEAVGRGEMTDFDPIPVKNRDEIGRLSVTFNQIMVELAEKKMLEEEVAMSEKLSALGRITAGVAHEVNNPLGGLLNCIDTMRKHPHNKELVDRYLPVIEQGLHRIKDIVHNLLVSLRDKDYDEIKGTAHIDKLQDLIMADIGERDIQVGWENSLDKDFPVPGELEQIVYNLLKNAVEVLPGKGTVGFSMYLLGSFLNIEVSDDGPGIPDKIRNQLFDPFFTTKCNGTGLGLWVVYRLTQNLGGVIEVESEQDEGTTIHVMVPINSIKAS
ncbi:MAG: HAMP domain-containing histidine kinase [Gammaproteobacteria bacterium]|nr:HAMP domain-containing histidine kinase [Gammaproteobacteria bacterium]